MSENSKAIFMMVCIAACFKQLYVYDIIITLHFNATCFTNIY